MAYKKDFLKNVIFRLDFAFPEETLKNELDIEVRNKCLYYFPITEQRQVQTQNVTVSNSPEIRNEIRTIDTSNEWHFFSSNRDKEFLITKTCILLQVNKYSTFDNFKEIFFNIYEIFSKKYKNIKINRIGLRYIDQIYLQSDETINNNWYDFWSKYIQPELLGGLKISNNCENPITRQMNSLETRCEQLSMRFKWGIFNSDYPAINKRKEFILDTDLYKNGLFDLEEIENFGDIFHKKAKEVFEQSITDELRKIMGM